MKQTFTLNLFSTYEEVEKIPDFADYIRDECSLDEDRAETFKLVLSEAVTNAVVHGNREQETKKVEVSVVVSDKSITADIIDEGEGFTPDEEKNPLKEQNLLDTSGRGLFLIRQFADKIEFKKNGTHLHFVLNRSSGD
ncbi:MAG: ATP-binding protein [Bacteroidetes bacterium]|jgi:serine/threonine-protein kinase RsbW|nr:ATP-binding protein [Bacteroidota bacterium]